MKHSTKAKLRALKQGVELPADPYAMAHGEVGQVPPTDERAVLMLAREYQRREDPDYCVISWDNQVKATDYFNAHGLADTLSEITRIGGPEALNMSALRYSGAVTIRVTWIDDVNVRPHGGHYRCTLSRIDGAGTQWEKRISTTQYVGAPAHLTHAIDCSEAYDDTAHAALSFASNRETAEDDDPNGWAEVAAYKADGSGWHVGRAPGKAWETMLVCVQCKRPAPASTAHRHQGGYIGDECCWDERLRASE